MLNAMCRRAENQAIQLYENNGGLISVGANSP